MPPTIDLSTTLKKFGSDDPHSILHLFETNTPPTMEEEAVIREILDRAQSSLLSDVPLANPTTSAQARRRRQRQSTKKLIDSGTAILHPIRRLSRKLLTEICLHALDYYADDGPVAITLDTRSGPWVYAQVCHSWRSVVVALPELWSVWKFDDDTMPSVASESELRDDPRFTAYTADIMQTIVLRSKDQPLNVTLDDIAYPGFFESDVFKMILAESHRWEKVTLYCGESASLSAFDSIKGRLPLLNTVIYTFHIWRKFDETNPNIMEALEIPLPETTPSFDAFAIAPQLRSVSHTHSGTKFFHDVEVSLPWDQLGIYIESYEDNVPIRQRMIMLNRLSNLVHLELSPTYGTPREPVCLPRLQSLTTRETNALKLLHLPALESLVIELATRARTLEDFFRRCQCPLRKLVLGDIDESIADALWLVPTLRTLSTYSTDYDRQLVSSLAIENASHADFLPRLTTLSLDVGTYGSVADVEKPIIQMVGSRRGSGRAASHRACLTSFFLNIESRYGVPGSPKRKFSPRFLLRFKRLEEEGLRVVLTNSTTGQLYGLIE